MLIARSRRLLAVAAALSLALTGLGVSSANANGGLTLTFETGDTYSTHVDFGGTNSSVVTDAPAGFAGTQALKVLRDGECWAGVTVFDSADYKLITSANKTVTALINAPAAGVTIRLKVEDRDDNTKSVEANASATSSTGWQTYTFDFANHVGGTAAFNDAYTYNKASFFFDFSCGGSTTTNGQNYFLDTVAFPAVSTVVQPRVNTSTLLTFEEGDELGAIVAGNALDAKTTGAFEGGATTIAAAPKGALTGSASLQFTKGGGAQKWAGAVILDSRPGTARYTNATYKTVTMNFYSPLTADIPVALQLEQPGPLKVEVTAKKGWQTLTFDFSTVEGWNADTEYKMLTLFPNFMNDGAADQIFYIDNIAVNGATTPAIPTALTPGSSSVSIAGSAVVGKTLYAKAGAWNGTKPLTRKWQWISCTKASSAFASARPAGCKNIAGATSSKFKITSAQRGTFIRVMEIVTNAAGTKTRVSKSTVKVK